MLHISVSKSVHICTFATVTVQICTDTVALHFIFLIFLSLHLSQSSSLPTDFLSSFVKLILNLKPKLIKLPIFKSIKNHQKPILQRRRKRRQKKKKNKKKMKWRRRRELRTHLLVWPVVLVPFLTESCVGERFWVEKIREGNVFLSFSLLFFSLGHFHIIDRRSRREEEEKSAKKQQQWRRERESRSDEKGENH